MTCDCEFYCLDQHYGHTCMRERDHDGPHSCHGRVFRIKLRKGDIVWHDDEREES